MRRTLEGVMAKWAWQPEDAPATPCVRCGARAEPARFNGRGSIRSKWCTPCRDFVYAEDDGAYYARQRAETPVEDLVLRARRAEIPAKALEVLSRADGGDDTRCMLEVHEWIGGKQLFLVLSGPTGCGKTVAACYALLMRERSGLFVYAGKLAQRSWYEEGIWRELETKDLLVIDDLGQEPLEKSGVTSAKIDTLLTIRDAEKRRTVITTNLASDEFSTRYGGRVLDRIKGAGRWFMDPGDSMRQPVAAAVTQAALPLGGGA